MLKREFLSVNGDEMTADEHASRSSEPEDRRKHLDFIQSVIARMSSASAVAKGWALTIAIAAYGYAGTKHSAIVALLGMFAVVLFATLDARYLREERKYRLLFEAVASGRVGGYEMNASRYCDNLTGKNLKPISWRRIVWSWSVRDYYGLTLLVGVALLIWIQYR